MEILSEEGKALKLAAKKGMLMVDWWDNEWDAKMAMTSAAKRAVS